jgi:hypothetical protein
MSYHPGKQSSGMAVHERGVAAGGGSPGKRTLVEQIDRGGLNGPRTAGDAATTEGPGGGPRGLDHRFADLVLRGLHHEELAADAPGLHGHPQPIPDAFHRAIEGDASALPFRSDMERAFGQEFASVRVHLGRTEAMAMLGARAATDGHQIAFAEASPSRGTVAHELTHVVQNDRAGGGAIHRATDHHAIRSPSLSDPADAAEREADAVASRIEAGGTAGAITAMPRQAIHRLIDSTDVQRAAGPGPDPRIRAACRELVTLIDRYHQGNTRSTESRCEALEAIVVKAIAVLDNHGPGDALRKALVALVQSAVDDIKALTPSSSTGGACGPRPMEAKRVDIGELQSAVAARQRNQPSHLGPGHDGRSASPGSRGAQLPAARDTTVNPATHDNADRRALPRVPSAGVHAQQDPSGQRRRDPAPSLASTARRRGLPPVPSPKTDDQQGPAGLPRRDPMPALPSTAAGGGRAGTREPATRSHAGVRGRPLPEPPRAHPVLAMRGGEHIDDAGSTSSSRTEIEDAELMRGIIARFAGSADATRPCEQLREMLESRNVEFEAAYGHDNLGARADLVHHLLTLLPDSVWYADRGEEEQLPLALRWFHLGGRPGPLEPADGGYIPGKQGIHVCDGAMDKPRNVFLRIVSHELGHAFFEPYLRACGQLEALRGAHAAICKAGALFAVDVGGIGTATERRDYQKTFEEFLAEVFMHYVLDHEDLARMVGQLAPQRGGDAWRRVYEALHRALGDTIESAAIWKALGLDPSEGSST